MPTPNSSARPPVKPGIEVLFAKHLDLVRGKRVGLITNPAGVDVGLVGVPFDLGTNFRTGARQGPAQIREMSRIIRRVNATSRIAPAPGQWQSSNCPLRR